MITPTENGLGWRDETAQRVDFKNVTLTRSSSKKKKSIETHKQDKCLAVWFVDRTAPTNSHFVSVMSLWQQELSVTNGQLENLNVMWFLQKNIKLFDEYS